MLVRAVPCRRCRRDGLLRGVRLERKEDVVLWLSKSEEVPATLHFLANDPSFEQGEENHEKSVPFF